MEQSKELDVDVRRAPSSHDAELADYDALPQEKKGTKDDQQNMWRMGKVQELRRNFRFITMFGFSMILMATWEVALGVSTIGLLNGGTAGLIWMFFITWMGFLAVNTSMAEMGSMAPTSGGQYHWVSEFAPREHQQFLSYVIGWLCVLAWQASAAATSFMAGTMIQGLLVLNYPDYVFERWHGTLLVFAVAGFAVIFNTVLAKKLPLIEGVVLVIHIFGFFAILVPLWVLGPRGDARTVFTEFSNFTGWNSAGTATIVGVLGAILPLLGGDAPVHLSEELRDAAITLPRTMIFSTFANGLLGWIMIISFCFCLGDLTAAISTPTGYAFIEVFYNATGSYAGANAMCALVIFMSIFCNLSIVATASRQLFSFARDQGVPFSKWLAYVPPRWDVPLPAILFSFVVSCLLSLINIGSTIAFNIINSISVAALLSSYMVSIGCIIAKRLRNEPMLPSKFVLGKWGLPLNIISMLFLAFLFVMSFWPTGPRPNAAGMNWSILVYGVIIVVSLIYFYLRGRHVYAGPVEYVRKSA